MDFGSFLQSWLMINSVNPHDHTYDIKIRASQWGWLDLAYRWLKIGLEKCMEHVNCYKQPLFKEMSNNFKR